MDVNKLKHAQVMIVGGGLSGALLALGMLKKTDLSILLVEKAQLNVFEKKWETAPGSFDERALALSYGSIEFFQSIGIWNDLIEHAQPMRHIEVSEKGRFGVTRLTVEGLPYDALGYVIEISLLLKVIYAHLLAEKNKARLNCLWGCELSHVQIEAQVVKAQTAQGISIKGDLLILAEGADSSIAQQLGITYDVETYHELALYANVVWRHPKLFTAYERFIQEEVLAFLPMTHNRYSMIWTFPSKEGEAIKNLKDESLMALIQARFGRRMGEMIKIGARQYFPLIKKIATEQIRHRLVVLGNAAHTIHPVAAQGLNLTVRDIQGLLMYCQNNQKSAYFGHLSDIKSYYDQRINDQVRTIGATSAIKTLFQSKHFPFVHLRSSGLFLFDCLPWVKKTFSLLAMRGS